MFCCTANTTLISFSGIGRLYIRKWDGTPLYFAYLYTYIVLYARSHLILRQLAFIYDGFDLPSPRLYSPGTFTQDTSTLLEICT